MSDIPSSSSVHRRTAASDSGENSNNSKESRESGGDSQETKETTTESAESSETNAQFECNICLDAAHDPVVSMCGHLFCWPCLHQWLETKPDPQICPVCKAAINKDKVVPLYGRGASNVDPRSKPAPPRPRGTREEPRPARNFGGFSLGDGFQMSFGIGAFPFGFFTTFTNGFGDPAAMAQGVAGGGAAAGGTGDSATYNDEQFLSRIFIVLAMLFILWIVVS